MTGVTLGKPHQRRGRLGRDGEGQHHAGAGPDPQQVLARQESRDPQARRLVLPDNGIRACRAPRAVRDPPCLARGAADPDNATRLPSQGGSVGRGTKGRDPTTPPRLVESTPGCCRIGLPEFCVGLCRCSGDALFPSGIMQPSGQFPIIQLDYAGAQEMLYSHMGLCSLPGDSLLPSGIV